MSDMIEHAVAAHTAELTSYVFMGEGKKCAVYRTPFIDPEGADDPPVFGPAHSEKCRQWVHRQAMRAAIATMREPNMDMLIAQHFECDPMQAYPNITLIEPLTIPENEMRMRWRAMIDAALA